MAAGGLNALQTMTIAAALPFAVILLIALVGLVKALRVESYKRESLQLNAMPLQPTVSSESWRERLQNIVNFPNRRAVEDFLNTIVLPAFDSVKSELSSTQIEAEIKRTEAWRRAGGKTW